MVESSPILTTEGNPADNYEGGLGLDYIFFKKNTL